MFSFPEDVPTARRLAQNWNTVTCPLLDQRRDSARIEYKRLPLLVRLGPICTKSMGQREMERISSARRHSTVSAVDTTHVARSFLTEKALENGVMQYCLVVHLR